jgi:N-acetylneuraminic acid mutarotase
MVADGTPAWPAGIATLNGKIYVAGGYSGASPQNNLWVYDAAADTWSEKSSLPRSRAAHALVAAENNLYLVGGFPTTASLPQPIFVYDPATDTWNDELAPLPTARVVEIYDPVANTWTEGPELLVAASGMTAAVLGGQIHVVGGEELIAGRVINAHQVLDLNTMTWTEWEKPPVSRHGLGSTVLNGQWFIINGGQTVDVSASSWVNIFTP